MTSCLYFFSSDFCTDRDTLFHEDFKMEEFIDCFEKQSKKGSAGLVTTVICTDEGTVHPHIFKIPETKKPFQRKQFLFDLSLCLDYFKMFCMY